jgi:hypothetical protein
MNQNVRSLDQFKEDGYDSASRIATAKTLITRNQGARNLRTRVTLKVSMIQLPKSAYPWIVMETKTW